MSEKNDLTLLSKLLESPEERGLNRTYINIILEDNIPVLCINPDTGKRRFMPFKVLYDNNQSFWQQGGSWKYYFTAENLYFIKNKAVSKPGNWELEIPKTEKKTEAIAEPRDEEIEVVDVDFGYGSEYKAFVDMSDSQRVECLNKHRQRLNELLVDKNKDIKAVTEALVDTTKDATMINHAVLEQAIRLADDEAKKVTQDMVDSTNEMVRSSAQLMTADIFNNELMSTLVEKSNGTIVQHMTRVYLKGIAFLSYYNHLVSRSSAIQKMRIYFASKYRSFYHNLLPHINIDDINLERVFYGGMRAIPHDLYFKWAIGFLIHDIGKAGAVEYHEGEASYDRNIVIDHVKQGYKSIVNKTNYPLEASLITGYHHEYYGDSAGYGYFRAYLQQYRRQNPEARQDYCITYELEPILDYNALAYFPAKVLEIVDVYDSVTDPNRVYRKALSPKEALAMMREEFIEKNHKLDIILFDIFSDFIHEYEKLTP